MKVVVMNSLYAPYKGGGAEIVVKNVVSLLQKAGHTVCVLTTKPLFDSQRLLEINGVRVRRISPLNIFWFGNLGKHNVVLRCVWHMLDTFNLSGYFTIKKILSEESPDIVLTHNLKGLGYLTPYAVKRSGARLVHTVHDVQLFTPSGLIIKGQEETFTHTNFYTRVYRFFTKRLFVACDRVIFPSVFLKNFYTQRGFFASSVRDVIRNPVVNTGDPMPMGFSVKRKFHVDEKDPFRFLFLGQLEVHKGIYFLLDALQQSSKNFVLHIVGAGSEEETVRKKCQGDQRFIVHGYIPPEKLYEVFARIDMMIFPSLCYENFPTSILDSFRFGVPVLASDMGGVPELVSHGVNGFLFFAGDEDHFAERLDEIFLRRGVLNDWSRNAYKTFLTTQEFDYLGTVLASDC
ncbi:MAG TPA: glycosyltransferase family 4 protein [Patescibacteria group bacterium]|nr:glycosyltransferase family 4 protein [Patescibacteria group bacterium]